MNNRTAIYSILIGGILLAALATVVGFAKIQSQIESSHSDTRPDLASLIFQIHSNLHALQMELNTYMLRQEDDVAFSDAEQAFDILWSQAQHADEGVLGARFLMLTGAPRYLENLRNEVALVETLLPGLQQRQIEIYDQVLERIAHLGSALNPLHLAAAQSSDTLRDRLSKQLLSTLFWIFALVFALALIGVAAGALIARDRFLLTRMHATLRRHVRARTRELVQRNSELESANARLRQFAQAASHDLQEPLRKIKLFSSDLVDQFGPKLTDEQDRAVVAINDSADRLHSSLQELLTLGRVSHRPLEFETLNLDEIISDTLEFMEDTISGCQAKIAFNQMPTISADHVQMRQLFRHLIGNALKFRSRDRACQIEIVYKAPSKNATGSIEIIDNGIGFSAEYGVRIFEPSGN